MTSFTIYIRKICLIFYGNKKNATCVFVFYFGFLFIMIYRKRIVYERIGITFHKKLETKILQCGYAPDKTLWRISSKS